MSIFGSDIIKKPLFFSIFAFENLRFLDRPIRNFQVGGQILDRAVQNLKVAFSNSPPRETFLIGKVRAQSLDSPPLARPVPPCAARDRPRRPPLQARSDPHFHTLNSEPHCLLSARAPALPSIRQSSPAAQPTPLGHSTLTTDLCAIHCTAL